MRIPEGGWDEEGERRVAHDLDEKTCQRYGLRTVRCYRLGRGETFPISPIL